MLVYDINSGKVSANPHHVKGANFPQKMNLTAGDNGFGKALDLLGSKENEDDLFGKNISDMNVEVDVPPKKPPIEVE